MQIDSAYVLQWLSFPNDSFRYNIQKQPHNLPKNKLENK